MSTGKTKSGKKAYFTEREWVKMKFEELLELENLPKKGTNFLQLQRFFFMGAATILGEIPEEWKENLSRNEPI